MVYRVLSENAYFGMGQATGRVNIILGRDNIQD